MACAFAAVALGLKGTGLKLPSLALVTVNLFHTPDGNLKLGHAAIRACTEALKKTMVHFIFIAYMLYAPKAFVKPQGLNIPVHNSTHPISCQHHENNHRF